MIIENWNLYLIILQSVCIIEQKDRRIINQCKKIIKQRWQLQSHSNVCYKGPNQKIMEEDIISAIKFDNSGKYLALGDKAGRIIIFESSDSNKKKEECQYFTQFQSHMSEFDPLCSRDVEEEIKDIKWLSPQGNYLKMLTSNENTIKLWKYFKKYKEKLQNQLERIITCQYYKIQQGYLVQLQKPFPSTNKGTLKHCDCRISVNVNNTAIAFKNDTIGQKNFLTQMVSCYYSAQFTKNAKYLVSRDFYIQNIQNMERLQLKKKKTVHTIVIQQGMKGKLCQMFENDCILGKFAITAPMDGNMILTGNYNNSFHLIDIDGTNNQYQLKLKKTTISRTIIPGKGAIISKMAYKKKMLAGDFNPKKIS